MSRKIGKAQQLSLCCNVSVPQALSVPLPEVGRAGRDGGKNGIAAAR